MRLSNGEVLLAWDLLDNDEKGETIMYDNENVLSPEMDEELSNGKGEDEDE